MKKYLSAPKRIEPVVEKKEKKKVEKVKVAKVIEQPIKLKRNVVPEKEKEIPKEVEEILNSVFSDSAKARMINAFEKDNFKIAAYLQIKTRRVDQYLRK